VLSHEAFAIGRGLWFCVGVDAGDADEVLEELGDVGHVFDSPRRGGGFGVFGV